MAICQVPTGFTPEKMVEAGQFLIASNGYCTVNLSNILFIQCKIVVKQLCNYNEGQFHDILIQV